MLPPLLARWTEGLLGALPPPEGFATCDRCAMQVPPGEPRWPGDVSFGDGKCCTYRPTLHNFLVGRILADAAPERAAARRWVAEAVAGGPGVTPLGVVGPRPYWLLYDGGPEGFGRSDAMRCPLLDPASGGCAVWPHREAVCATWFCKHERAAAGAAAWRALRDLLVHLERSVARACLLACDPGPEALAALLSRDAPDGAGSLTPAELDGRADPAARRRQFGRWHGREAELFLACARHAEALDAAAVLAAAGSEGEALLRVARARRAALDAPLPAGPLRLARADLVRGGGETARLKTYSGFDLLEVPRALVGALPRFDGRPTAEVVEEARRLDGLLLDDATLRALLDFGVLVPAEAEPPAASPPASGVPR